MFSLSYFNLLKSNNFKISHSKTMFPILLFILLVLHLIAQGVSASCAAFSVQNTTTNLCDCLPGLYNTPSGSPFCGDCDLSCQTCNGPTPTNCTSCFSTDTMTNGQCISPPSFLFHV